MGLISRIIVGQSFENLLILIDGFKSTDDKCAISIVVVLLGSEVPHRVMKTKWVSDIFSHISHPKSLIRTISWVVNRDQYVIKGLIININKNHVLSDSCYWALFLIKCSPKVKTCLVPIDIKYWLVVDCSE